jgi:branched-chain amino acid transport system permease protein
MGAEGHSPQWEWGRGATHPNRNGAEGTYDPVLRAALIYWATLAVAVISVAGVFLLVRRTFGLDARAVGSDPVAAASAGVRVGRIRRLA